MTSDTDFWLLPAGLEQQADVIDAWSAEFSKMNESLVEIVLQGEPDADVYNYAIGQASQMHTGILQWIAHMQNVFSSVSAELRDVAREGRTMDLHAAARLDKYSPNEYNGYDPNPDNRYSADAGLLAPKWDRYDSPDAPVFKPMTPDMGFYLDAGPGAFDGADEFAKRLFPEDLMSPAGWIRTVMEHAGALSFRQQILSGFGGYWSTLRWYAHKLEGISKFLVDAHSAMVPTVGAILIYWQGYSANSAASYFEVMLDGMSEAAQGAQAASNAITEYCDAVKSTADIVGGEVEDLYNTVLFAAAAAAFGKQSIVGWVVGGSVAGLAIARAASLFLDIRDAVQEMQSLQEIFQAIEGLLADMSNFTAKLSVPQMVETS